MESLKGINEICDPDTRQRAFVLFDQQEPGGFRHRTLQDFHRAAEKINLHEGVPEEIRSHFETARNLIIYSWFYYPLWKRIKVLEGLYLELETRRHGLVGDQQFCKSSARTLAKRGFGKMRRS